MWMRLRRLVRPEVTVAMGSRHVRIDLRDRIIAKRLYLGIAWERDLQQLLAAMSLRGGVCLDIGAYIGIHSLTMSELVGPAGRVYAFEPERHNFAPLEVFPQALRAAGSSAQEVMERLRDIGMVGWEFLPRLQPVQPPWIYELIRDGDQVDVIVCRNAPLLEEVLTRWHGGRLGP